VTHAFPDAAKGEDARPHTGVPRGEKSASGAYRKYVPYRSPRACARFTQDVGPCMHRVAGSNTCQHARRQRHDHRTHQATTITDSSMRPTPLAELHTAAERVRRSLEQIARAAPANCGRIVGARAAQQQELADYL